MNKNKITEVNLDNNAELDMLVVSANPTLTDLDVSNNKKLTKLFASSSGLDSNELKLGDISSLGYLNLYQNNLTSIDLSKNTGLIDLNLSLNDLDEGDIDFSKFPKLRRIYASGNSISNVDLSNNIKLYDIDLYRNELGTIVLPKTSSLEILKLSVNKLKSLDVFGNIGLKKLCVSSNNLTDLNLSSNSLLESANIAFNSFTSPVKFANNNKISYLWIDESALTSYNLRDFSQLKNLGTVYEMTIPVYGSEFYLGNIVNYILSNISVSSYSLYNTFNGISEKYKIYDSIPDDSSETFSDVFGAPDSGEVSQTELIKGTSDKSYKIQLLA